MCNLLPGEALSSVNRFVPSCHALNLREMNPRHRNFHTPVGRPGTRIGATIRKLLVCCAPLATLPLSGFAAGSAIDFNRDVRPILSDKCFFCHGFDEHERKADLRLDTAEGATAVLEAGDGQQSEFLYRIGTDDEDDLMPPPDSHKSLSPEEIAILEQWLAEGAHYDEPWAYVAPEKTQPTAVSDDAWPANWIDRHVLARLDEEGLSPSPDADPVTLVRRLHFDLIGLPPEPATVGVFLAAFANDPDSAVSDLVDTLLASPHFGERMAAYWFDLVRFADTVGYHGDQDHNISPYRDYVIAAFNGNLPFDQFTREQLAGDLLPGATLDQKIASGYNRLLQTSHEGGIQAKEYNAIYAADRVRNLSAVWMGATVGCAQCHDHKYDPYSIKDHYALAAFFADIHDTGYTGNAVPTQRPPEILVLSPEDQQQFDALTREIEALIPQKTQAKVQKLEAKATRLGKQREQLVQAAKGEKENAIAPPAAPPSTNDTEQDAPSSADKLAALDARITANASALQTTASAATRAEWRRLLTKRAAIEKRGRKTMITVAKPPREMRILPRGNWQDDSGEIVQPAVPAFLPQIVTDADSRPPDEAGKGTQPVPPRRATRLDLANWLCDPDQGIGGLTARVMANRFWYLCFGTGISRSLADFGGQGEPPANPALLDALAVEFLDSGWDVKALMRLLVTSRAYRQSSIATPEMLGRDPHNQLVDRQSRYRLPAEMIRDSALAISGLLVRDIGGRSVRPYQPAGYYRHLNFPKRTYDADEGDEQWRRGVYVHWQRMFLHPMMRAMDAPSREECTAERARSNTPTAALTLLNDPTFIEAARVFATRILSEGGESTPERLDFAFREALGRPADPTEQQLLTELHDQSQVDFQGDPEDAAEFLAVGRKQVASQGDTVALASWTTVARAILNLSETITRN
jgi:hypothetical protein